MRPSNDSLDGMDSSKSTLSPYELPADEQIIVWVEDAGKPFIRGMYDEVLAATAKHATYRAFVKMVGEQAGGNAVRHYRRVLWVLRESLL
jgi:hypothetical protein